MGKAILCACEDVTLSEVRRAFDEGHRDLESVKRYTGFGTGPCQGKECLAVVALQREVRDALHLQQRRQRRERARTAARALRRLAGIPMATACATTWKSALARTPTSATPTATA